MKAVSIGGAALLLLVAPVGADVIAQWDFNATNTPSAGSGTLELAGGVTATYATGCTNDPVSSAANKGWNTSSYPSQGGSNKTAGVQFAVSTLGYSDIEVRWDHRVSNGASKYCRLQFAADGTSFLDAPNPVTATAVSSTASFYESQTNSLAAFPEINDNPNLVFRIVSEFESTAAGGADQYITTYGSNYSRSGTIRFDMLTVSGIPIPGANTPPTISRFANQTLRVNQSSDPIPFQVWDAEDPPENLLLSVASSEPSIISESDIVISGSGPDRVLTVTAGGQPGQSILTLRVTDSGGRSSASSFVVTVLTDNTSPVISGLDRTNTLVDVACAPLPFSVYDAESPADTLTVAGYSANPALVPNDPTHIAFGGSGTNRTITLTPAAEQSGIATITVTVSDGTNTVGSVFPLIVTPSPAVLFYDPFDYPDGSLLTNSGGAWENRSGVAGQCQVIDGAVQLTASQSEDVSGRLIGGPYASGAGSILFASFRLRVLSLPKPTPEYFAHFIGGSSLRGRVYAAATDVLPGCYRLGVANGSDTNTMLVANLSTNTIYTVVTRYDLDTATTTLWVNPAAESDRSVTAGDTQSPISISAFGFRQDSRLGATLLVDNLVVGTAFTAVLHPGSSSPIPLTIEKIPGAIILRWSDPLFTLHSAMGPAGPFLKMPQATSPFTNLITEESKFFRLGTE